MQEIANENAMDVENFFEEAGIRKNKIKEKVEEEKQIM